MKAREKEAAIRYEPCGGFSTPGTLAKHGVAKGHRLRSPKKQGVMEPLALGADINRAVPPGDSFMPTFGA